VAWDTRRTLLDGHRAQDELERERESATEVDSGTV